MTAEQGHVKSHFLTRRKRARLRRSGQGAECRVSNGSVQRWAPQATIRCSAVLGAVLEVHDPNLARILAMEIKQTAPSRVRRRRPGTDVSSHLALRPNDARGSSAEAGGRSEVLRGGRDACFARPVTDARMRGWRGGRACRRRERRGSHGREARGVASDAGVMPPPVETPERRGCAESAAPRATARPGSGAAPARS